ncbi:Protein of unknown function DUF4337 [uncultured Caudovirales phage]|uniref:DUF4337 domain-containing protein n=1 Tax=uncultured Caudovirales phage TaxID=2100421 RepID=A0A6J5KM13_9CAUD|nr:Protein of unknown function DUF4337 [uncultured Caudovirales phage]
MSEVKPLTRSELEIIIKKRAAIWITVLAALLAVNTMFGGSNSSKVMGNTIASNNQWAWYQAKNVRSVIYATTADTATDKRVSAAYQIEAKRMRADMDEIAAKAKALEAERDQASRRSPYYTYAGMALQLGIVLSTAAILAVAMPLFWTSLAAGSVGVALFLIVQLGV